MDDTTNAMAMKCEDDIKAIDLEGTGRAVIMKMRYLIHPAITHLATKAGTEAVVWDLILRLSETYMLVRGYSPPMTGEHTIINEVHQTNDDMLLSAGTKLAAIKPIPNLRAAAVALQSGKDSYLSDPTRSTLANIRNYCERSLAFMRELHTYQTRHMVFDKILQNNHLPPELAAIIFDEILALEVFPPDLLERWAVPRPLRVTCSSHKTQRREKYGGPCGCKDRPVWWWKEYQWARLHYGNSHRVMLCTLENCDGHKAEDFRDVDLMDTAAAARYVARHSTRSNVKEMIQESILVRDPKARR